VPCGARWRQFKWYVIDRIHPTSPSFTNGRKQLTNPVVQPPCGMMPAGVPKRAFPTACKMQHPWAIAASSWTCAQQRGCSSSSSSRQPASAAGAASGGLSALFEHLPKADTWRIRFSYQLLCLQGFCNRTDRLLALISVHQAQVCTWGND
jgi:hypothetical protein